MSLPAICQQLHSVGDKVMREVLSSEGAPTCLFRLGVVDEVYSGMPGHNVTPPVFYAVRWNDTGVVERGYLGTGLKRVS